MTLFEAIYAQRAIRRFKSDPVPQEAIEQIIEAAVRAPSGGNRQPWSFVVIRDDAAKRRIGEWYLDGWNVTYASDTSRPHNALYRSAEALAHHIAETPVLILACTSGTSTSITSGASIYPAVQNLMLAAAALGLGTVITTFHRRHEEELKQLLGIPADVQTAALIPVGYPANGERFGGSKRRPITEIAHYDRWGAMVPTLG
jgi:nitroreductase